MTSVLDTVFVLGRPIAGVTDVILTPEALTFLAELHRNFNGRRKELLEERQHKQAQLDMGIIPKPSAQFTGIREAKWTVDPVPEDLQKRWVEITGPVERKQIIGALNCGADVFMADFEDASAPSWTVMMNGQVNIRDAVRKTISLKNPDGSVRTLKEKHAALLVRPRGWHLVERNLVIDGEPISASLFDAGLYLFHNGKELVSQGKGGRFYLPKMESGVEAALWADVLAYAENRLGLSVEGRSTTRATVLIETIFGCVEAEEIVYALRRFLAGLNAGRWDYIFSVIKRFRNHRTALMPDRTQVTMTAPFMAAYCRHLVDVCHRRGAHAIGGMAANVPSRTDQEANKKSLALVQADKKRELGLGFDGTWVAHPDLVAPVRELFTAHMSRHGLHQKTEGIKAARDAFEQDVLDFSSIMRGPNPPRVTVGGISANVSAALLYIACWITGTGAVALDGKMEDAATAEISRAQLWQWLRFNVDVYATQESPSPSSKFTADTYILERKAQLAAAKANPQWTKLNASGALDEAAAILDKLVLQQEQFDEFLTLDEAYDALCRRDALAALSAKL